MYGAGPVPSRWLSTRWTPTTSRRTCTPSVAPQGGPVQVPRGGDDRRPRRRAVVRPRDDTHGAVDADVTDDRGDEPPVLISLNRYHPLTYRESPLWHMTILMRWQSGTILWVCQHAFHIFHLSVFWIPIDVDLPESKHWVKLSSDVFRICMLFRRSTWWFLRCYSFSVFPRL